MYNMKACEKIVIDLTKSLANCGEKIPFCGDFALEDGLLPYPDAKLEKVSLNFWVTYLNPNVSVCGTITVFVSGSCDRCLEKVSQSFVLNFDQTFFKDSAEEGCYAYFGSKLDVTKAVQDEIVLSVPTLLLCSPNCKGLCPKCGANKNHTDCGCDTGKENAFSALKNLKF